MAERVPEMATTLTVCIAVAVGERRTWEGRKQNHSDMRAMDAEEEDAGVSRLVEGGY